MKLILCLECQDVRKLLSDGVECQCGKSGGRYLAGGLHAETFGPCVPIGFNNSALASAIRNRPRKGVGVGFGAFVIPEQCLTIKHTAYRRP